MRSKRRRKRPPCSNEHKKARISGLSAHGKDYARVTLPAFMHLVHTFFLQTLPFFSTTVIFWMFGRNIRLVTR